jgi:hypothetical protein
MKKSEKKHFVNQFLNQYINPIKQYEDMPNMVFNNWITWLYDQWNCGMISIREYRVLIRIDLDEFIGV